MLDPANSLSAYFTGVFQDMLHEKKKSLDVGGSKL